jgi:hypothetical protein
VRPTDHRRFGDREDGLRFAKSWFGAAVVTTLLSMVAAHGQDRTALQGSLDVFCTKWMGFLEDRERDNKQNITWRQIAEGVEGDFIGYDKKYTCLLSEARPDTKVPVGTIKYLEFKYRHKGPSSGEALSSKPKIIEVIEVTEIFRYSKNQWVY